MYSSRYQSEWETDKDFHGQITKSDEGNEFAYCKSCRRSVKVSASGRFDVVRHFESVKHKEAFKKAKQHIPVDVLFRKEGNISISIDISSICE